MAHRSKFRAATDKDSQEVNIARVYEVLESVAKPFAPGSDEALAVKDAAMAYRTVRENRKQKKCYNDLCSLFDDRLTDEMMADQRAKLRARGIDPDELDDDDATIPDQLNRTSVDDSHDTKIGRACAILESIAKQFAAESDEALAIRDAAMAYATIRQNQNLKKGYERLRSAYDGRLTDEMMANLRLQGIDPDELDDDIGEWNLEK